MKWSREQPFIVMICDECSEQIQRHEMEYIMDFLTVIAKRYVARRAND